MVEITIEFVKAVHSWEELVAVTQMVLTELTGSVAQRLEQFGDRRGFLLQALRRAWQADLGVAGSEHALSREECRSAGGAALLAVVIREHHPLARDAVDIRSTKTHQTVGVRADVRLPDIVAPDH